MEVALEQKLVDPSMDQEALNLACGSLCEHSTLQTCNIWLGHAQVAHGLGA